MTIGEKIRIARKDRQLTQKELSEKAGVAEITIRSYENGKRQPQVEQLEKIAAGLGVRMDFFFGSERESPGMSFHGWLEALGYKVVFYEEEDWSAFVLKDLKTDDSYSISRNDLQTLIDKTESYTRYLVSDLIESVKDKR